MINRTKRILRLISEHRYGITLAALKTLEAVSTSVISTEVATSHSRRHSEKDCIAIFPQTFVGTDSWVQLDDDGPAELKVRRIDSEVWKEKASDRSNP